MITIRGGRWWKRRTPVEILIAAEENAVLLAVGSGNYVELSPSLADEVAEALRRAASEAVTL